jgi:hypothetical protein
MPGYGSVSAIMWAQISASVELRGVGWGEESLVVNPSNLTFLYEII